jgi:aminopeptidase N
MKRTVSFLLLILTTTHVLLSQRLPSGTYRPNRERTYDIIHYKADIKIDWAKKQVIGESTIKFRPLHPRASIALDAYRLNVGSVRELPSRKELSFRSTESELHLDFGRTLKESDTTSVVVQYTATPTAGLYVVDVPMADRTVPSIFTYGEGGIHANWLPIYNEPNDKFTTEMVVTVAKEYQAISNGTLLSTKTNADGTRTFHWYQSLPHSNYLIALFVGEYVPVKLRSAFGSVPLTVWTPPGTEDQARHTFSRTPEMIEFFSHRFGYRYPWEKYDQVAAYDYAIGAMENTSITGHNDRILRAAGQTEEFNPDFEYYNSNWTAETLVSHELAHHWFGDNLTCRSLASIWLNESFASYLMMLWDEHRLGQEYLQSQTWLALQQYLRYVATQHIIRPLEYRYFDSRAEIYNNETTYLKGAVVLNMLRWILGDDDFFRAMGYYLKKHQFSNVESNDLKTAIEEATGKNLQWFFDQWIYGGGHPVFEMQWQYLPDRRKVEVTVNQVQPIVEGQGLFKLPVEIRIDAGGRTLRNVVWVEHETEHFTFDVPAKPEMVSFDGRGVLVCEVRSEKDIDELIYQLGYDDLPGRLWALQELARRYASNPRTLTALRAIINGDSHWSLRAEATLQLRQFHAPEAESLLLHQLQSSDYHIRKAAVIALGSRFTDAARQALRRIADSDTNDDVAATALVALSKTDPQIPTEYLQQFLNKKSWYDVKRLAALKVMENVGKPEFVAFLRAHASMRYNYAIRAQALTAWRACSPTDPQLVDTLLKFAKEDILPVRSTAIALLGKMKVERALPVLEEIATKDGDSDIRTLAKDAIEEIQRMR